MMPNPGVVDAASLSLVYATVAYTQAMRTRIVHVSTLWYL